MVQRWGGIVCFLSDRRPSVLRLTPDSSLLSSPPCLQAQRKEPFIQERYSRYNLSDPFLALQRDSEALGDQNQDHGCSSSTSNPLVVLKLVVSHCRTMQEKMLAQLAAAESRHRRVGVETGAALLGGAEK